MKKILFYKIKVEIIYIFLIIILTLVSTISYFGYINWVIDLISSFKVYYLILSLVLIIFSIKKK